MPAKLVIVAAVALAALWMSASGEAALRWSAPVLIDRAPPTPATTQQEPPTALTVGCRSISLCVGFLGQEVMTTTRPDRPGAWSPPRPLFPRGGGTAVSCPSLSLCVAFSGAGEIAVSTRPTTGAWRLTRGATQSQQAVDGLACPTVSLCVAVDLEGDVITSRDPAGGPAAWTVTHVEPSNNDPAGYGLYAVSCPSARLCVATDPEGKVFTSTDPTGGSSAWSSGQVVPDGLVQFVPRGLRTVSCSSTTRCVATNTLGDVASSNHPSAGASSWRVIHVARATGTATLACVSSLCIAGSDKGVVWSRNPTARNPRWRLTDFTTTFGGGLSTIACPSVSLCVGGDAYNFAASIEPAGAVSSWRERPYPIPLSLQEISCPTTNLCVAADDQGDVVTSTHPGDRRARWRAFEIGATGVSCGSASLCATSAATFTSRDPAAGRKAWKPVRGVGLSSVSCPTASLCVGASGVRLIVSTNPAGGSQAWRSYAVDGATYPCPAFPGDTEVCRAALLAVSCPTSSFCLAVDNLGNTLTSTNPAGDAASWTLHQADLIPAPQQRELPPTIAVSCPAAQLCVAVNSLGEVETSTNPTGGASDWVHTGLVPAVTATDLSCGEGPSCSGGLTGVSCRSTSFCAAVDAFGDAFTSSNPTGGVAAWSRSNVNRGFPLNAVSCATRSFCIAVDTYGYAVIGRG